MRKSKEKETFRCSPWAEAEVVMPRSKEEYDPSGFVNVLLGKGGDSVMDEKKRRDVLSKKLLLQKVTDQSLKELSAGKSADTFMEETISMHPFLKEFYADVYEAHERTGITKELILIYNLGIVSGYETAMENTLQEMVLGTGRGSHGRGQ